MIQLNENGIANIDLLNEEEAKIFVAFLYSEIRRHEKDVIYSRERIELVATKFGWNRIEQG